MNALLLALLSVIDRVLRRINDNLAELTGDYAYN